MTGSSSASLSTKAAVFLGALVAGTGCSLTSKMLLSMKSVGASGEVEDFENPLFQTWGMFIGMCMALPVHMLHAWCTRPRKGYASIQTAEGGAAKPAVTAHTLLVLALPSLFDLAATALCMFGLVFIPVGSGLRSVARSPPSLDRRRVFRAGARHLRGSLRGGEGGVVGARHPPALVPRGE